MKRLKLLLQRAIARIEAKKAKTEKVVKRLRMAWKQHLLTCDTILASNF